MPRGIPKDGRKRKPMMFCHGCKQVKETWGGRCADCRVKHSIELKAKRDAARLESARATILKHYGAACSCCGESEPIFLTIDHMNNDGGDRRKAAGSAVWEYVLIARAIQEGKPPTDLRILCFNCNCGRARNGGVCPHGR